MIPCRVTCWLFLTQQPAAWWPVDDQQPSPRRAKMRCGIYPGPSSVNQELSNIQERRLVQGTEEAHRHCVDGALLIVEKEKDRHIPYLGGTCQQRRCFQDASRDRLKIAGVHPHQCTHSRTLLNKDWRMNVLKLCENIPSWSLQQLQSTS